MQTYIRYELEKRRFSSNVILGIYEYQTEKGEVKEKSDIVIIPSLKKEDGDVFADAILGYLNGQDALSLISYLVTKGFICEIFTDAWANWKFKDNKPDRDTATPLYTDKKNDVSWRGNYHYFHKETGKLVTDDTGLCETPQLLLLEMFKCYNFLKPVIDENGFNSQYIKNEN